MFLSKLLLNLDDLPPEGTLVAERIHGEFQPRSRATVIELSDEDLQKPYEDVMATLAPGMEYFLEVGVARDLLLRWAKRRPAEPLFPHEVLGGLIYYAENKAFPAFVLSETEYLDQLLSTSDDFDLCNGVFCRFAEFNNEIDVASYSEEERVVTLAWHAGGLIGNGGFEFLFEGEFNGDPDMSTRQLHSTPSAPRRPIAHFKRRSKSLEGGTLRTFPSGSPFTRKCPRRSDYRSIAKYGMTERRHRAAWLATSGTGKGGSGNCSPVQEIAPPGPSNPAMQLTAMSLALWTSMDHLPGSCLRLI